MQVDKTPTRKQVQAVVFAFLRTQFNCEYDAIQASLAMKDQWALWIDWHEFSYALDHLHTLGEAEITRPGGYTRYRIIKKEA